MTTQTFPELFTAITNAITSRQYEQLQSLDYSIPEKFNWVRDVFEAVHVKNAPDHTMLELLAEDRSLSKLSYKNALRQSNQLLNYLRKGGVQQGDTVFVMCGLHKGLWLSYLGIIKGGFVMIP
ncbi:MAG: hypothetical protein JSS96_16930, partial [Bacteroidetes bacterium]|nr:hypothetical protein [Bacteroidota bacterium]